METNTWFRIGNQNLAVFMRDAGFDLAVFDQYSPEVQKAARKAAISEAMWSLEGEFEDQTDCELKDIEKGIYVISLADGLSVKYRKKHSPVIYIGIGKIHGRIKSHYEKKLFDFMKSLSGVNFNFHIATPKKKWHRKEDYHKAVEYFMLEEFSEQTGGMNDKYRFPLMNKISGSNREIDEKDRWWATPLKNSRRPINWRIEPTDASGFIGGLG